VAEPPPPQLAEDAEQELTDRLRPLFLPILERPDQLVDAFIQELHDVQGYELSGIGISDLREANRRGIEYLIRTLLRVEIPADLEGFPHALGRKRASQGLPLSALTRALRLNFSVLWRHVMLKNSPPAELLVPYTLRFWDTLEQYATDVQTSYLEESNARNHSPEYLRRMLMDLLITSNGNDHDSIRQLAVLLGVDPASRFRVVHGIPNRGQAIWRLADRLQQSNFTSYIHETEDGPVAIVELDADSRDSSLMALLARTDCSLSPPADGMSQLPMALESSHQLAQVRPDDHRGVFSMGDGWIPLAVSHLRGVGELFIEDLARPLRETQEPDRSLLLRTLAAFLESGSVTVTAQRLYCHRNTIVNRLNRVKELTGLNANTPREAATLLLMLEYIGPGD